MTPSSIKPSSHLSPAIGRDLMISEIGVEYPLVTSCSLSMMELAVFSVVLVVTIAVLGLELLYFEWETIQSKADSYDENERSRSKR
jgi:hypothetical protein